VSSDPNKHQNELAAKLTAHQNAKAIEDATIAVLTAIKPVGSLPVERPARHPPRKVPIAPGGPVPASGMHARTRPRSTSGFSSPRTTRGGRSTAPKESSAEAKFRLSGARLDRPA
jgi:hypothetical protein